MTDENTFTFTGTIIGHVLESLVPVVCVKQLEDVIPCEDSFTEEQIEEAKEIALLIGCNLLELSIKC